MEDKRRIGLGCTADQIAMVASSSPRMALAMITPGAIKAPYIANIVASFTTASPNIATGDLDSQNLGTDILVHSVTHDIQAPNAFTGSQWKNQSDYYFNRTSGIAVQINVTGRPKYTLNGGVSSTFTPLIALSDFVCANWPNGWVLLSTNSLSVTLQPTTPIPFLPATVTISLRAWNYISWEVDQMSPKEIKQALCSAGYDVGQ